jgi:hypothetical protein
MKKTLWFVDEVEQPGFDNSAKRATVYELWEDAFARFIVKAYIELAKQMTRRYPGCAITWWGCKPTLDYIDGLPSSYRIHAEALCHTGSDGKYRYEPIEGTDGHYRRIVGYEMTTYESQEGCYRYELDIIEETKS